MLQRYVHTFLEAYIVYEDRHIHIIRLHGVSFESTDQEEPLKVENWGFS